MHLLQLPAKGNAMLQNRAAIESSPTVFLDPTELIGYAVLAFLLGPLRLYPHGWPLTDSPNRCIVHFSPIVSVSTSVSRSFSSAVDASCNILAQPQRSLRCLYTCLD